MPLVSLHGRISYANLPLTYYIVAGVLLMSELLSNPEKDNQKNLLMISGFCLMLVIWTRPEGVWMILPLILIFSFFWIINIKDRHERNLFFLLVVLPVLVLFGFWMISRQSFYFDVNSKSNALRLALSKMRQGYFQLEDLRFLIRFLGTQLISSQNWLMIGTGLVLTGWFWIIFRIDCTSSQILIWVSGLVVISVVSAMYYTLAFDINHDMSWWLTSGLNRQLMPGMTLLWIGIMDYLQKVTAAN
jgi:hypothetical protein